MSKSSFRFLKWVGCDIFRTLDWDEAEKGMDICNALCYDNVNEKDRQEFKQRRDYYLQGQKIKN